MTTRENLIADGQDYGERQESRDLMQSAGIPLEASPAAPVAQVPAGQAAPPAGQPGSPMTGLDLLLNTAPGDYGFLGDTGSEPVPDEAGAPTSTLDALAAGAQSTFALAVLNRLQANSRRR